MGTHENRMRRRARQYLASGNITSALDVLESLRELAPEDPSVHCSLGEACLAKGMRRAAVSAFVAAAGYADRLPNQIPRITHQLLRVGESSLAHDLLRELRPREPVSHTEMAGIARLHYRSGDIDSALSWIEQALAGGVDQPGDHYLHGLLLQFRGRMEEAAAVFLNCMRRWPGFSGPVYALSRMDAAKRSTVNEDSVKARFDAASPGSVAKAEFAFTLFELFDKSGRFADAWEFLAKANAIMAARNPYAGAADKVLIDSLMVHATNVTEPFQASYEDGPVPIFIIGLPRSGTTLLDRMLSTHSQVVSAGELRDFYAQVRWATDTEGSDFETIQRMIKTAQYVDKNELGSRYLAQTRWRAGNRRYYIDKLPNNLQLVNLIRQAIPAAPILCMTRNPMAVCFSNFKAMFGDFSPYSYTMQGVATFFSLQKRLIRHWNKMCPGAMMNVSYEDLVVQPEQSMRRILDYCGLEYEPQCSQPEKNQAAVNTPSSVQVREPIHQRGISDWTHYESCLEPMKKALCGYGFENF